MTRITALLSLIVGMTAGFGFVQNADAHKDCCKGKKTCPTNRAKPQTKAAPAATKPQAKACECHGHACGTDACSHTNCAKDCPGHAS